ncbi:MAG TPA: hypothetical protein VL426_01700 [Candidatus Binatia bacterium]|jgi:hypothetical protein|nr:hypothetical protein [Candidatus Binatia bacterium]
MEPHDFNSAQASLQLIDHIDRCGGVYSDWYVGMTNDPERLLFDYHLVDKRDGQYFYCRMSTYHEARFMIEHLSTVYRVHVGPVYGGADALYVYAFKMTTTTRE